MSEEKKTLREQFEENVEVLYGEEEKREEEEETKEVGAEEEAKEETTQEEVQEETKEEGEEEEKEEEQEEKKEDEKQKKKKSRFQKRIDRLVAEKYQLLNENKQLKEQLLELKKQISEMREMMDLLMDSWEQPPEELNKKMKEIEEKTAGVEEETKETLSPETAKKLDELDARLDDARERIENFDSLLQAKIEKGEFKLSEPMLDALLECEDPGEVVYYLLKHPKMVDEIFNAPPAKQAVRIAKLEVELKQKKSSAKEKKNIPAGATQKPPTPVNTSEGEIIDPSKLSDKEYLEWRRKQLAEQF